ncbi:hypothetical protein Ppb6_00728 [Photorhabdus australis subsp. thailandensis]|uniref:Uncharacterized protein n=1 Tax=Photorhabdus australis subsp. thailandensis TaxID=2805096 RepID=A0A1C0U7Z8_9GAMM|nr:hypothetical protein [Photorhabdus australis]OCQ54003.1 hypothetical protein Ppb6_00728 [Photorhabdus australis subsp. thailandensis]
MIYVKNASNKLVLVAINKWGKKGGTGYFNINPGTVEGWDRTDGRGFVMSIIREGEAEPKPYFVLSNSNIIIHDKDITGYGRDVEDSDHWIYPLN